MPAYLFNTNIRTAPITTAAADLRIVFLVLNFYPLLRKQLNNSVYTKIRGSTASGLVKPGGNKGVGPQIPLPDSEIGAKAGFSCSVHQKKAKKSQKVLTKTFIF